MEALEKGLPNLLQHVENMTTVYGLPAVVAINAFPTDTDAELKLVEDKCRELGVKVALSQVWEKGGEGGAALAEEVVRLCDEPNDFAYSYDLDSSIEEKIEAIATKVYRAKDISFGPIAKNQLKTADRTGIWESSRLYGKDTVQFFPMIPKLLVHPETLRYY